jgi:hypothetical protein
MGITFIVRKALFTDGLSIRSIKNVSTGPSLIHFYLHGGLLEVGLGRDLVNDAFVLAVRV